MRELPAAELESEVAKAREKLWKLRFQARGEPLENPGEIRRLRREIARMKTILRERELAGRAGSGE